MSLLVYTYQNLGAPIPAWSEYHKTFAQFRAQLQQRIITYGWGHREQQAKVFLEKQFEHLQQEYAKEAEKIDGLLRALAKEDGSVVLNQLSDPEPLNRWLGVLVVAKKRMPAEEYLIDLLADKHPAVRQAAHQALARISRSTDFGPAPKATTKQIARSQELWRNWLETQVEARLTETAPKSKGSLGR